MRAALLVVLLGCGGTTKYVRVSRPCEIKPPPVLAVEPFVACNAPDALACITDPEKFVRLERYLQDAAIWMRDTYTKCGGK